MSIHTAVCVCDQKTPRKPTPQDRTRQNRMTAACVSAHTHCFAVLSLLSTTLLRIHNNYIHTSKDVNKGICIQNDYVVGGGHD